MQTLLNEALAFMTMFMVIGSVIGTVVIIYSVLEGVFMVYDRIRYGKPFLS